MTEYRKAKSIEALIRHQLDHNVNAIGVVTVLPDYGQAGVHTRQNSIADRKNPDHLRRMRWILVRREPLRGKWWESRLMDPAEYETLLLSMVNLDETKQEDSRASAGPVPGGAGHPAQELGGAGQGPGAQGEGGGGPATPAVDQGATPAVD